jgi:hypothetical protein
MIIFLLITGLLLALAGFGTLVHALNHAVDGYEDESGFYEGSESQPEGAFVTAEQVSSSDQEDAWIATRLPQRAPAESVAHHGTLPAFK